MSDVGDGDSSMGGPVEGRRGHGRDIAGLPQVSLVPLHTSRGTWPMYRGKREGQGVWKGIWLAGW